MGSRQLVPGWPGDSPAYYIPDSPRVPVNNNRLASWLYTLFSTAGPFFGKLFLNEVKQMTKSHAGRLSKAALKKIAYRTSKKLPRSSGRQVRALLSMSGRRRRRRPKSRRRRRGRSMRRRPRAPMGVRGLRGQGSHSGHGPGMRRGKFFWRPWHEYYKSPFKKRQKWFGASYDRSPISLPGRTGHAASRVKLSRS